MGLLVDGTWSQDWYDTKKNPAGSSNAPRRVFETGLPRMVPLGYPAQTGLLPSPGAIIFMSRWLAPGPIAP